MNDSGQGLVGSPARLRCRRAALESLSSVALPSAAAAVILAGANQITYTYDAVGNRLNETKCPAWPCPSPTVTNYSYDSANRLTNVNGQTYQWDDNGNLLDDGTSTYAYDAANRLTSVTQGTSLSTYGYRCNGLSSDRSGVIGCESDRVSQTVNGVTTNYVLDLAAGLTQVLSDGTNTYLYGPSTGSGGRIGELQPGGFAYHLDDALGSVRQLVDASGGVTLARSFEPYGTELNKSGTGSTVMSFTGEMLDSQTNLLYLRARFYASYLNQWIQPDTIVPDWFNPQTLNHYAYVNNNPINFTDPSGHCSDDPNVDDDECWKMYAKVVNVLGGARNQRITRDPRALAVLKAMDKYDLQSLLGMIRMRKPYPLSQSVSTNYDTRLWLVAFFGGLQSMENSGGKIDAVEAMARWVEFTVALHSGMGLGSNQVMDDLLLIENGLKKNGWGGIYDVPEVFQEMGPGWFNDSGFASIFQDNDDQVFHAMLSIAVGSDFPLGPFVAEGVNIFHETVDLGACRTHNNCLYGKSVQDLLLSQRAIAVGVAMNRSSAITWGDWIRLGFRGGVFISPFDWPIFKDC